MKHFFAFIILLLLTYQQSAGQCLTVKGMRSMFFKDMDAQDKYMTTKGFELIDGEEGKGYIWKARKGLGRASADIDEESKVWQVDYYPPGVTCFTAIKSEVAGLGLKKDAQVFKENFICSFYSGPSYGIQLYRFTGGSSTTYYVAVLRKSEYRVELARLRALD